MIKFLFGIALFFSLHSQAKDTTTVSIIFHNAQNESVRVCAPPCDYQYFATDTLSSITNDSLYQYKIDIKKPSFMSLIITNKGRVDLLLQPKDDVTLEYDFKAKCPYSFTGKNAAGQYLLNKWTKQCSSYKYEWTKDFTKAPFDTIPETMDTNFQKLKLEDIAVFDSLVQKREINKSFRDFMARDIELYYLASLSRLARNACETINQDAYYQYWSQLYNKFPIEKMETGSLWFYDYAKLYIINYLKFKKQKEGIVEAEPTTESEYYQYTNRIFHEWTNDKKLRELAWGNELFYLALNNKTNSTDLIPFFEQFKKDFPDNVYIPVFEKYAQNINLYHQKTTKSFGPEIRFLDKRDELKTLKDVFGKLKGKAIFVDFWFSTCGRCREEFEYAKPLKEFLKKHQIELLYISIDKDNMDENWKNSIKYFDLSGWHVRVPHDVHVDMDQNYGIHLYPTYMLVDKEGNIVTKRAKYPSEKEELYKQIEKALNK